MSPDEIRLYGTALIGLACAICCGWAFLAGRIERGLARRGQRRTTRW